MGEAKRRRSLGIAPRTAKVNLDNFRNVSRLLYECEALFPLPVSALLTYPFESLDSIEARKHLMSPAEYAHRKFITSDRLRKFSNQWNYAAAVFFLSDPLLDRAGCYRVLPLDVADGLKALTEGSRKLIEGFLTASGRDDVTEEGRAMIRQAGQMLNESGGHRNMVNGSRFVPNGLDWHELVYTLWDGIGEWKC